MPRRTPLANEPAHPAQRAPPAHWEKRLELRRLGSVRVRPVRPEDIPLFLRFYERVTPEDMRLRLFSSRREFPRAFIAPLTHFDRSREMAFLALAPGSDEMFGVVRAVFDASRQRGEYGLLVRSDLQECGLGGALMNLIIEYARGEGAKRLESPVLAENAAMLKLARVLGFDVRHSPGDFSVFETSLDLTKPRRKAA